VSEILCFRWIGRILEDVLRRGSVAFTALFIDPAVASLGPIGSDGPGDLSLVPTAGFASPDGRTNERSAPDALLDESGEGHSPDARLDESEEGDSPDALSGESGGGDSPDALLDESESGEGDSPDALLDE